MSKGLQRKLKSRAPEPLPYVAAMAPYRQGKSKIPGTENPIKLSSNESCFGPSPAAVAAYHDATSTLHRYPDGAQQDLRRAIGKSYGIEPQQIVCGNGSEEVISMLIRSYVSRGDEVLMPKNHFVMCSIHARGLGAEVILAEEHDFTVDVDELLKCVTPRTRLIAVANPNNPTGTYIPFSEIQRLVDNVHEDIVILLDGAYAQYVMADDFDPGFDLVASRENVFVTHSFSKVYGLAGLRIGWGYGPPAMIDYINRLRTPFNASIPAMAAASAAVLDHEHVERVREHTHRWQTTLRERLASLGIHVIPSVTNFYLMHFENVPGKNAEAAGRWLEDSGIIPRPASDDRCLRITVGSDEENEAVITALTAYVES